MMNKNVILLATCLLAFGAVWGTLSARKACEVEPIDLSVKQKTRDKGQNAASAANSRLAQQQGQEGRLFSAETKLDELWSKTLFKPERQEIEETQNAENLAEQQVNAEFELAGIASLGLPGKAEPVAIIRIRQNTARNTRGNSPRSTRGGSGGMRPPQPQQQQQVQPATNVKTVFRKGEPINNTGYTLAAIYPKEKMVELSRGRDVIKLYIEYNSELSQQRRKTAAAQEEAANRQRAEQEQARMAEATRARQQNQPFVQQGNATGNTQPAANATDPALLNNAVPAAENPTPNRPPMPPGENAAPQGNGGSFRRNRQGPSEGGGQRR